MKKTDCFLSRILPKRQKGRFRKRRAALLLLLLPAAAMLLIPLMTAFSAYADGEGFSYQITSVSPTSGSVQNEQHFDIMYGEPLVLDISVSQPCKLSVMIMGFSSRHLLYQVTKLSDTQFRVSLSPEENVTYEGTQAACFYFLDEEDNIISQGKLYIQALEFQVKSVTMEKKSVKLRVGESMQLRAVTNPVSAPAGANISISWESDSTAIAEVSEDGVVTAKALGQTTIYAFASPSFSFLYDTCSVEVVDSIPAEGIAVAYVEGSGGGFADGVLTLGEAETASLTAELTPENASEPVTWESSDPSIAAVDSSGGITGVSMGNATVTAKAGTQTDSVEVRVLRSVAAVPADCTNDGTKAHWQDKDGNAFADSAGRFPLSDTQIPALGHNWYAWETNPTNPALRDRECARCHVSETQVDPNLVFGVTDGDNAAYIKGSNEDLLLTVDRINYPAASNKVNVFHCFEQGGTVTVTGPDNYRKVLGSGDFDAEEGSLKLTLKASYLEGLQPGAYSFVVTFVVAPDYPTVDSKPGTFTVAAPAASDTPDTGESVMAVTFAVVLMTLAVCGCAFVFFRKRRTQA